jgi:hypothetical protein
VFLRAGYAGFVTHCRVFVVSQITSFLTSLRGSSSCSWMGTEGLSCSAVGNARSQCTVGARPPSTSRVADCHSVEELGFKLLVGRDGNLLQGDAV